MQKFISWLMRNIPRPVMIRMSYFFSFFIRLFYVGNKVECPVCDSHFRKFLPYGALKRRDSVLCPKCLSLERHRLLWMFLKEKTDFFTKKLKVLHIAPEQSFIERFRKLDNLDYTTADLVSPLADIKFDVHDIPFEENSFDVIMCNHVLEHVEDDRKVMSEFFRVLRPGGFGIFQVPIDITREETYEDWSITSPEEREIHFWQKDHVRLYGLDYGRKLELAGFKVTESDFSAKFSKEDAERFRIMPEEVIYFCEKN